MIIRTLEDTPTVDWGNGLSRRFLLDADGLGYSVTDTVVRAGTTSMLEYRNHLESCYCIEGTGAVREADGTEHRLQPGVLYALDNNDPHYLIADEGADLRLVCVFLPALHGTEAHRLVDGAFSAY